jgi:hypothetical protein
VIPWAAIETFLRTHPWHPLELFIVILVLALLVSVAALEGLGWWHRRATRRLLYGGSMHGYADPARRHRETWRDVDRSGCSLLDPQSPVPLAGVAPGGGSGVRPDAAAGGVGESDTGHVAILDERQAVAREVVDRLAEYGTSTTLVVPARARPDSRVNEKRSV